MSETGVTIPGSSVPPSAPNNIFRGPHGIRAGWRVLIFLALFSACALAVTAIGWIALHMAGKHASLDTSALTPLGTFLTEGFLLILTVIPALIMGRIEHRRFRDYGLPGASALGKNFWIGGVAGFLAISVVLLSIFLLRGFQLTGLAIHGSTILQAVVSWSVAFLVVGLAEEFAFRGYLQFTLTTGLGFWPAAIVLSLAFGMAHAGNPGETKFGLLSVVLFGLLFCLFLRRTGNLWWAVGFHAGWDWGQTFFYGVPDSGMAPYHNLFGSTFHGPTWLTGGAVGPESSVFTPIALGIVAIIFSRCYRENCYQAHGS